MAVNGARRRFLKRAAIPALAAPFLWRRGANAAGRPHVVVIGGGAGGATLARRLAGFGAGFAITLVEPKADYTTCFFSNRYLAGAQAFESLTFGYERLAAVDGIRILRQQAVAIEPGSRKIRLADGSSLAYDRLAVAPGIDFRWDAIEGYGPQAAEIMPHSWQGGPQTRLLRKQLEAMEDGGVFLIAPPEEPYRCPSGPYERVSLVAHYFQRSKPRSKIVILDAKSEFPLQAQFEEAWVSLYPGMIEVIPGDFAGGARAVDTAAMTVTAEDGVHRAAVANIIPPQQAGRIARDAGLADAGGWCPVAPDSFESRLVPGIHVIGDAAIASPMPKSGYAANLQAKLCAQAILHALTGRSLGLPPMGGACWSHLTPDTAIREYAEFAVVDGELERTLLDISPTGQPEDVRVVEAVAGKAWYEDITADMFGL